MTKHERLKLSLEIDELSVGARRVRMMLEEVTFPAGDPSSSAILEQIEETLMEMQLKSRRLMRDIRFPED